MDGNAVLALVGGVVVAFVVKTLNMVTTWLARILAVDPPDPIPDPLLPGGGGPAQHGGRRGDQGDEDDGGTHAGSLPG